jgi:dienelactone hydrolase
MALPLLLAAFALSAAPPPRDPLADGLRSLAEKWPRADEAAVFRAVNERLQEAGNRESRAWAKLTTRAEWKAYREARIEALRRSLGTYPEPPRDLQIRVRSTLKGDGVSVDSLTFTSRPGVRVTANLYRSATPADKPMPGFVLVHSHHNPKTEGELQDMGVMWARAGCVVLVMDQLGHGERRQHPFRAKGDYPEAFRISRQDYFLRHNVGLQLQTIGDSLMGWMVWDIRRGVDLLLARKDVDAKKIVLLGAVAGGGDPVAVAGAIDTRIAVVGPFNFGGPQPESRYPLPDDETRFRYTGSGSWESTRNLARSAKDGFLPWVIVGAIAPRRHLYGHEFSWDKERDPVWKRLNAIYAWHRTPTHLASATGTGVLSGRPPAASHCNNIGPVQRKGIHAALERWLGLPIPEEGRRQRWTAAQLAVLADGERPEPVHRVLERLADERRPAPSLDRLRAGWTRILGDIRPARPTSVVEVRHAPPGADVAAIRVELTGEVPVKALILRPDKGTTSRSVVAVAQGGPTLFLTHRAGAISALLHEGTTVVLVELGGLSHQPPGKGRGRGSSATSLASSQLMLGEPSIGVRLRELRTLLMYLRTRDDIDPARVSLWGDSFATVNADATVVGRPLELEQPAQAEPLGGILALVAGLIDDRLASIEARGGLASYRSILAGPFVHVPADVIVPGVLTAGDLPDIVRVLPMRVTVRDAVDGVNRRVR